MADTLTPNIKLTNQTEGGNANTWGQISDDNMERIDDVLGDVTLISTTGGTTTLTDTQELVNAIEISGTLVANATIVFSGRGGSWVIRNATTGSYTLTCKVSGQTGVSVDQGATTTVYCNGTDIRNAVEAAAAAAELTVASATTADVLGAASEFIAVSGTTTVTSFGTGANRKRFVRATGAFLITHHATSLICPGGQNIKTASGDTFILISDSSSNVRIFHYQRAEAPPQAMPLGAIMDYAGTSAPSFWLFCYGQNVSRTTYAALFAAISTTYGVGDGSTTFTLPDCRGRARIGKDNMGGSSADRLTAQTGGIDGDTLGAVGGAETHVLTSGQMAAHTHTGTTSSDGAHRHFVANTTIGGATVLSSSNQLQNQRSAGSSFDYAVGGDSADATVGRTSSDGAHTHTFTTASTGSDTAHNNVQPSIIFNTIIFAGV